MRSEGEQDMIQLERKFEVCTIRAFWCKNIIMLKIWPFRWSEENLTLETT
jgi:hypothetical protein